MRIKIAAIFAVLAIIAGGIFGVNDFRVHNNNFFPEDSLAPYAPYGQTLGAASVRHAADVPTVQPPQSVSTEYQVAYQITGELISWGSYQFNLHVLDLASNTVVKSMIIRPQHSADDPDGTMWYYQNLVVSHDGRSLFVYWLKYNKETTNQAVLEVYALGDNGLTLTKERTLPISAPCPGGVASLSISADAASLVLFTGHFGCRVDLATGERTYIDQPDFSFAPGGRRSADLTQVTAVQDPTTSDIAVAWVTSDAPGATVVGLLHSGGNKIQVLDQIVTDTELDPRQILLFRDGVIHVWTGSQVRIYSSGTLTGTYNIANFRGMVDSADGAYIWVAQGRHSDNVDTFSLYTADFSSKLTTVHVSTGNGASLATPQHGYGLFVAATRGDGGSYDSAAAEIGTGLLIDPSAPRAEKPWFWWNLAGYAGLALAAVSLLLFVSWIVSRRRKPDTSPAAPARKPSWWVARSWMGLCAVASATSLVLLVTPLVTGWSAHAFPDRSTTSEHAGRVVDRLGKTDVYPQLDPRMVNQQQGVSYSMAGTGGRSASISVTTLDGQLVGGVSTLRQDFDNDYPDIKSLAISHDGAWLYAQSGNGSTAAYAIGDQGRSLTFARLLAVPNGCHYIDQLYPNPDGSLTMIKPQESLSPVHHEGDWLGCRINPEDGRLLEVLTWGPGTPASTVSIQSYDPATGNVFFMSGGDSDIHRTISVLHPGSATTDTLPLPADLVGVGGESVDGSLVVSQGHLYALFGMGVYSYALDDLMTPPTLVWEEPDAQWGPYALVRSADQEYWWVVEFRNRDFDIPTWLRNVLDTFPDPRAGVGWRYSLYSDSFADKLTTVYNSRNMKGDYRPFFASTEGHYLLVGAGCFELYGISCEADASDYYNSPLMVDPSADGSPGERWSWWFFGGFAGFGIVGLLSFLRVRKAPPDEPGKADEPGDGDADTGEDSGEVHDGSDSTGTAPQGTSTSLP